MMELATLMGVSEEICMDRLRHSCVSAASNTRNGFTYVSKKALYDHGLIERRV